MILLAELKRIFAKAPVLVLIAIILPLFVVSAIIVGIEPPSPPLIDLMTSDYNQALVNFESGNPETVKYAKVLIDKPLNDLRDLIYANDVEFMGDLYNSFEVFARTWNEFLTLRQDNREYDVFLAEYRGYFVSVNQSYIVFENEVEKLFGGASKVLITTSNYNTIRKWMTDTEKIIEYDENFTGTNLDEAALNYKRLVLQQAWDAHASSSGELEKHGVYRALHNSSSISFTDAQKETLRNIYANLIMPNQTELFYKVRENTNYTERRFAITRYADYTELSCEYLNENIKQMQAGHTKNVTKFQGFSNYNKAATRDRLAVLEVLITQGKASFDYSNPYKFGGMLNKPTGTTAYDFVFNCLELISIPLIIIACLVIVFCIFDDIQKNTVLTALLSPQGRRRVILSKMLACTIAIAAVFAVFAFLFFATASIVTGSAAAPSILFAFGGKAHFVKPATLLFVYMLSLFFKILFFASITALFCLGADSYKDLIIRAALVIGFIIMLNVVFSVIFSLTFYQYLPFVAIDFAGFLGIKFMLSRHLASTFIWFTLPILLLAWFAIIMTTVLRFERRDF